MNAIDQLRALKAEHEAMAAKLARIDAALREFEGMTSTAHKYMAACIRKAMSDDPRDMEQEARDTEERR